MAAHTVPRAGWWDVVGWHPLDRLPLGLLPVREDAVAAVQALVIEFFEGLIRLHKAGKLAFFGDLAKLVDPDTFAAQLAPLHKINWLV